MEADSGGENIHPATIVKTDGVRYVPPVLKHDDIRHQIQAIYL